MPGRQHSEKRRFALKLSVFLAPFLICIVVQHFFLPIDYFNFRVWEALIPVKFQDYLPGPFYPNLTIHKIEEGDLAYGTRRAIKKDVLWTTDLYGLRNQPHENVYYPIVVVGDSNAVGSGLTQNDMLGSVLSNRTGLPVYTEGPKNLNWFLEDARFIDDPPKVVILEWIEWLTNFRPVNYKLRVRQSFTLNPTLLSAITHADRLYKMPMLLYARARFKEALSLAIDRVLSKKVSGEKIPDYTRYGIDDSMLFAKHDELKADPDQLADLIGGYDRFLRKRNIHLIFLPLPDKSNIYYLKAGKSQKPGFLNKLLKSLQARNVDTVDLQTVFERERDVTGELLFHPDDSHWTSHAVRLTAESLLSHLKPYLSDAEK